MLGDNVCGICRITGTPAGALDTSAGALDTSAGALTHLWEHKLVQVWGLVVLQIFGGFGGFFFFCKMFMILVVNFRRGHRSKKNIQGI